MLSVYTIHELQHDSNSDSYSTSIPVVYKVNVMHSLSHHINLLEIYL